MPKGKFVTSMLNFFGRKTKEEDSGTERVSASQRRQNATRKNRRSMLDADSFVFLPGEKVELYWGAVLNDQNYPISAFAADYSTARAVMGRRQTVSSNLTRSDESGTQNVKVLRPRAKTNAFPENSLLKSGDAFSRRLSGTLVKSRKTTDEVGDGSILLDYGLCVSDRERWSQDLSGRYVYDRLFYPPNQSGRPKHTSTPDNDKAVHTKQAKTETPNRHSFVQSPPVVEITPPVKRRPAQTSKDKNVSVRDHAGSPSAKANWTASNSYFELESDRIGSEYDLPWEFVDWERIKWRAFQDSGEYASVDEACSPLLGKAISSKEVFLEDKIGEGQFGDVHKGVLYPNTHEETMVAIKTCKPDATTEERTKFLEEAAVMRRFSHPHIIKLFGVMSDNAATYIIMELAPYGQLRRYLLTEGSRISRVTLIQYIHQLSMAMVHLETLNFVHRDIAARNVLVASHDVIKLADFGLSRGLDDTDYYVASRGKLPIKWMAPESINFRRFTGLSDVWMFGVCCWEILMRGVKPFVGIKNDEVISKIELGERLALPAECPATLFRLMNLCWQYDPMDRPSFRDVEQNIMYIVEEEKQIDALSHRRSYGGGGGVSVIQRDPNAPEKPTRNPAVAGPLMNRVPSDSHVKRLSALSSDDQRLFDERGNGPALPPRPLLRMRDPSVSPPTVPSDSDISRERTPQPTSHYQGDNHPPPLPIEPYSVTTIASQNNGYDMHVSNPRRSESPLPMAMTTHIPPPAIIRQPPRDIESSSSSSDVYYSTPAELAERGSGRVLNEQGVFVDQEKVRSSVSSADSNKEPGLRPRLGDGRPLSHASSSSSGRNSPVFLAPAKSTGPYVPPDDDPIVMQTTVVVRSVMELSNKVPLSRPTDYVEFVKNVGLALRELLGKVDAELKTLPQQTHQEVAMAQKVLSSDMTTLVEAMKNAQKNYQTFLESDYQKQMLKAAHVVAVNSKLLLDAVNSARTKAQLMQR